MRVRSALFLASLTLVLLAADQAQDDEIKKELDKLQGSWLIQSWEQDGKADESHKAAKVVFAGDTFTRQSPKETVKGKVKLDPKAKPKTIDTTYTEGPNKDKTILAIMEMKGERIVVCYNDGGKERPKEFATTANSGLVLIRYKKQ